LNDSPYIDKVRSAQTFQETHDQLPITSETDRVYTPALTTSGPTPIVVKESGKPSFVVTRDNLPHVTVWNGWEEKIKGMGDFEPKDGWKRYVCVEPGAVLGWVKLEAGDAWEGMCGFESKL
jgi:glucose-6-phosphate 1-epimerase